MTEAKLLEEAKKMVLKKRGQVGEQIEAEFARAGWGDAIKSLKTRLKPLAQTGKFKVWVVLGGSRLHPSDLIRGLADEDIKKKVLAMP